MLNTSPAFRCKVTRPNTRAYLRLGTRRRPVEVIEMSRDSFTVRLTKKLASKVKVGSRFRLFFQDVLWSVCCKEKWINHHGEVDVEFLTLEDLSPPPKVHGSWFASSRSISASGPMDGTLAMMLIGTLVLAVLIMPAWGGKWGTSQAICDGVTIVFNALKSLVTGRSS